MLSRLLDICFKKYALSTRTIFISAFCCLMPLLLSGCKLAMLDPQGLIATEEKHILVISVFLMLLIVVPVISLIFLFAWWYRAGNTKAHYAPDWSHSTLLEVVWWSIPCIIIAILGTITWTSSHSLDPYKSINVDNKKPLTIEVIALQWKWLFIYPEQNIATINTIQIPVNTPVRFLITAEGPMNSFQIPQLAGQIYAMTGMQTKLHVIANKVGDYRGISANFSGNGFSDMMFTVHASSQEQFAQWVKTVKRSPTFLTLATYNQLMTPSEKNPIQYFSVADKTLFQMALMKPMMPEKEIAALCKTNANKTREA
ncbi:MAG: ubiquinol oxidase subunit II [Gammaproteobacteria bacterium]|nr:ubiquinol oxidase subunit II [Gammaproteobacteria bacterium]